MKRNLFPIALFVAACIGVPLAFGDNNYVMGLIISSLIIAGVALAWAMLGNLGGMISFGHAAFFGVGAYASALLTLKLGWPVLLAMPAAGLAAVVFSLAMLPTLRLSGPYFALAMLAYAQIFRILATEFESITNGAAGLSQIPALPGFLGFAAGSRVGGFLLMLGLLAAFAACYAWVRRSHYGLALRAMHDSEKATRVVGVNSVLLKAWMLFLSAFMTGVVGAFNAHTINFLDPDYAFNADWSVLPIVAAVLGGYRTLPGPVIGAVVITLVDQLVFKAWLPIGHQIVLGIMLAAIILFSPDGLAALFRRKPVEN